MKQPRAWQRMLSGRRLDLLDPTPVDIELDDIAHGLAFVARWNGQTHGDWPYSVAEHSLLVENIIPRLAPRTEPRWRLAALLHDAPEYVIGDMISPVKAAVGPGYKELDIRLTAAIHIRFGLPALLPVTVKTRLGWDTDQFPTDIYLTTQCMLVILKQGGLQPGGINFDAKVRRESFEPVDLFHAHIGGMDAFARGAKIAAAIRAEGVLEEFVANRYASYDSGIGQEIENGTADFASLEAYMLKKGEITPNSSGRQEYLENLINRYL